MAGLGAFHIDENLTVYANTHDPSDGSAADAASPPTYRVYEEETGTAILTGSMALLDDANTVGFYSEQIALTAANGFEVGKSYGIYIAATVGGIAGTAHHHFKMASVPAVAGDAMDLVADALDSTSLATTATNEVRDAVLNIVTGTADSGSTTTIVDAERTEADANYWRNAMLEITSGANIGQIRRVTIFDEGTDTITVTPAFTNAVVAGVTYRIIRAAADAAMAQAEIADAVWDENIEAAHGTDATAGLLLRVLGAAISNRANNATLDALLGVADAAGVDIAEQVWSEAFALPAQGAPPSAPTAQEVLEHFWESYRNKLEQTASEFRIYDDAGTTVQRKAAVTDAAGVTTRAELASGP